MGMFSPHLTPWRNLCSAFSTMGELLRDGLQFLTTISRSRAALAAEILFLRKQLAYYQDHRIRPRRLRDASRLCLLFWSRLFDWQAALVVVKTNTFIVGIAKGSSCTGVGSREAAAHRSRKRFGSSSLVWSEKT
jgi:hypothetical protein